MGVPHQLFHLDSHLEASRPGGRELHGPQHAKRLDVGERWLWLWLYHPQDAR